MWSPSDVCDWLGILCPEHFRGTHAGDVFKAERIDGTALLRLHSAPKFSTVLKTKLLVHSAEVRQQIVSAIDKDLWWRAQDQKVAEEDVEQRARSVARRNAGSQDQLFQELERRHGRSPMAIWSFFKTDRDVLSKLLRAFFDEKDAHRDDENSLAGVSVISFFLFSFLMKFQV